MYKTLVGGHTSEVASPYVARKGRLDDHEERNIEFEEEKEKVGREGVCGQDRIQTVCLPPFRF